jgi:hypothetical protein
MGSFAAKRLVILWGGVSGGTGFNDVWKWDGTTWMQVGFLNVRSDAAAIDVGPYVLFFGGAGTDGQHDDLMAFDGASWSTP